MGTNLNSNIVGAKRASELTNATGNLRNIYSKTEAKQREALSELFTQKYFNSSEDKAAIDKQIKALEEKIKDFEKQIKDIEEKIEGKEDKLKGVQADIADKVANIVKQTGIYEADCKERVDNAIKLAYDHYKEDSHSKANQGEYGLEYFIIKEMSSAAGHISSDRSGIDRAIEELGTPQTQLNSLVKEMEGLTDGIDTLNSQYGTTKSTLELLKLTRNNMTDAAKGYQTSDTNPSVPIFTPEKEDLADGYLAKYNSRMANRENQKTVASAADKQAITNKYAQGVPAKQTPGSDPYSTDNAQLVAFSKALDNGMLDEMANAGFTQKEVLDSIKQIFPSIGIVHGDDGSLQSVPQGHWSKNESRSLSPRQTAGGHIYTKFLNQFGKVQGGTKRDDLQVAEMNNAINKDGIISEMKKDGFTWKECAYTLTRLWPGAGLGFNLGEKEITIPNGDSKSKGAFDSLADQIKKNYPDIKINRGTSDEKPPEDVKRTDPVGFNIGNDSYEFVIDRNKDGVINNFTEMVGANGTCGIEEMKLFDKDGDGHLTGDELENVLLLNTNHGDKLNYEFLTAAQLGVLDIDLDSFAKKEQQRPDGTGEDFVNINNSLITGTFDVKLKGGKTAEGYQKYVTADYAKAVYDGILGDDIYSELSNSKVENVINRNFNEAKNELKDINHFDQLVDAAKGYEDIKSALRTKLNHVTNEANAYRLQETVREVSGYKEPVNEEELEMPLGKAEKIIDQYLEEAEKDDK